MPATRVFEVYFEQNAIEVSCAFAVMAMGTVQAYPTRQPWNPAASVWAFHGAWCPSLSGAIAVPATLALSCVLHAVVVAHSLTEGNHVPADPQWSPS